MSKKKKRNKKKGENYEVLASIILLLLGLFLIILFIFLVGEKVNEEPIKPGKVIYNNPGVRKDDQEGLVEDEEQEEQETEDEQVPEEIPVAQPPSNPTPVTSPVQGTTTNWWSYPTVINVIPSSQVTLTTVVDKANRLEESYVPNVVTQKIETLNGRNVTLTPETIDALTRMTQAAYADGITDMIAVSTYRSFQTQRSTYNYWVSYNGGNVDAADKISARPGHSEHQLGTVVDFSTLGTEGNFSAFATTRAYAWLLENAGRFGFRQSYKAGMEATTGYSAESWHWRYWGE